MDCPENIGLDVTERFYKRGNLALEYDLKDWLHLNQITSIPYDKKRLYRYYRNQIGRKLKRSILLIKYHSLTLIKIGVKVFLNFSLTPFLIVLIISENTKKIEV